MSMRLAISRSISGQLCGMPDECDGTSLTITLSETNRIGKVKQREIS